MIFSLDVRRARKGDCLILHYGTKAKPGLVLIDGGPAQVYGPQLKPRLEEIRKARRLAEGEPLTVDLLMVSHIDDDHINGILELTHELVDAKAARRPLPLKVLNFWHNTFDDIIASNPDELVASVKASFGPASLAGEPDTEGLDPHTAKVLASVGQGLRLRDDARALGLRLNSEFGHKLIKASARQSKDLPGGLKLTVAGPMEDELLALQKEHAAFLKKAKKNKEAVASFTDSSVANLSSIVVLAEAGGKRMLLTGDARGDKILLGLEKIGLLVPGGKDPPRTGGGRSLCLLRRWRARQPGTENLPNAARRAQGREFPDPSHLPPRGDRRWPQRGLEEGTSQREGEKNEEFPHASEAQLV
jgi:Metallo-beta-lactamase superfamily